MVISFPALICLEATWRHILAYTGTKAREIPVPALFDAHANSGANRAATPQEPELTDTEALAAIADSASASSDGQTESVADSPLTAAERRARAAALRGLALSRGRHFAAAGAAFAEAARLDPKLDLSRTPGFWALERAAHEAAIAAYDAADRVGDAAILRARVRSTYRPKPLRPLRRALLHSGVGPQP